ncbi:MAG: hypothetical protein EOO75_01880 [Myxococcales bacterium]|nr:MAG: hypothetical protein EOO75_01880 [Myxococcales bacterium]
MPPRPLLLLALALAPGACAGDPAPATGRPADPGATGGYGGSLQQGGASGAGPAGSAGAAPVDCAGVGGEIHAITVDGLLVSFEPPTQRLTVRGQLTCPGIEQGVYSMAVDRQGQARVLLQDGRLLQVDPLTLACRGTGYAPLQQGWQVFGMGYATTKAAGPAEALYVADATRTALQQPGIERGLARIDGQRLTPVGAFDGGLTGRLAELTGRGDGRLFAFFVQEPSVAEIDPLTAHILSNTPVPVPTPTAWAFAHWGGAFYVFAAPGQASSRLYRHRPGVEAGTLLLDTGFRIVGAGVSTCAPLGDGPVAG